MFLCVGAVGTNAQQWAVAHQKAITHDVYDSWKSIQGTKLSRDGVWLVCALTPQDGDGQLVVRNLKTNAEPQRRRPHTVRARIGGKIEWEACRISGKANATSRRCSRSRQRIRLPGSVRLQPDREGV
jgi:hypothetical protein